MELDHETCYRALKTHDRRFDGLFFVAVKTTGIYCRPVCPARTPRPDYCRFFHLSVQAEKDGFRPCLRCRPERAPGRGPIDSLPRIVGRALRLLESGFLEENSLEDLAAHLGVTSRHLRRAIQVELGVSLVDLAQTRRLALAKQLLHETELSMTDIAFASGFSSIRRFNDLFRSRFGCAPSGLRKGREAPRTGAPIRLQLEFRPPYDWQGILEFLGPRLFSGVEVIENGLYSRTVRIGTSTGWIRVSLAGERHALKVEVSLSLARHLMSITRRIRRLFDLDAHPGDIASVLGEDPRLRPLIEATPGIRVPGSFFPFETAIRTVLGQQISVKGARTLTSRLVTLLGEPIQTTIPGLERLPIVPAALALAEPSRLQSIGLTRARTLTLVHLARAVEDGSLDLRITPAPEALYESLLSLPGIGPWSASYLAMRALGWPDAFPAGDLGLRKALGGGTPREIERLSEGWRPWRAYAAMLLWRSLFTSGSGNGQTTGTISGYKDKAVRPRPDDLPASTRNRSRPRRAAPRSGGSE